MKVLSIVFGLVVLGAFKASAIESVYVTNPVKISTQSIAAMSASTQAVSLTAGSTVSVQGLDAHDAAVTARPVLFAIYGSTTLPTAVTLGDAARVLGDQFGRVVVVAGCPKNVGPVTVNATASGDTVVISSPGANTSIYVSKVIIMNRDSANVVVSLAEGSSASIKWRGEIASEGGSGAFSAGSALWKLAANTQLAVNLGAASNVDVNVMEYCLGPSTP